MSRESPAPFAFSNGAPNGAKCAPFFPGAPIGNGNGAKVRHSPLPLAQRSLAITLPGAPVRIGAGGLV